MPFSLFCRSNHSSTDVTPCTPWTYIPVIPHSATNTKSAFRKWCKDPATNHCFFSGVEAINPHQMVSKEDNPAHLLHAIVLDFDAPFDQHDREKIRTRCPAKYQPNYLSSTFSGHGRMVYLLPVPVQVISNKFIKAFLEVISERIGFCKLAPNLDINDALLNPALYYEVGSNWECLNEEPTIPNEVVEFCLCKAGGRIKEWLTDDIPIPIEVVADEVARRFPGRWQGDFEIGKQGKRFWDPTADNETAAIVRESGVQFFTQGGGFKTWKDLFGKEFTEEYEIQQLGRLRDRCVFDGKRYWFMHEDRVWREEKDDPFKRILRGPTYNLDATKPKGYTQLDSALEFIEKHSRIDAALPLIHRPQGRLEYEKEQILNVARCVAMPPAKEAGGWGERFPWFAEFLDTFFSTPSRLQRDHFLSWWKWFYSNALTQTPQNGQAIFIAGPAECGKTLLATGFIAKSVGGFSEANRFLMGQTEFSKNVCERPVMTIDDGDLPEGHTARKMFTNKLKSVVANQHLTYRRMHQDPKEVAWMGRAVITCNLDAESLNILPNIDQSNADKLMFFEAQVTTVKIPERNEDRVELMERELPEFLAWLLAWEEPEEVLSHGRLHTAPYQHKDMLTEAIERSASYSMQEALLEFLAKVAANEEGKSEPKTMWEGTANQLVATMSALLSAAVCRDIRPRSLSNTLTSMARQGYNIKKVKVGGMNQWQIPLNLRQPNFDRI